MIIIADIAGQFDALMRLVKQIPEDERIVLVGDLVDRGPDSKEVVDWAMKTKRVTALMGNHEHMMLDYWCGGDNYPHGCWFSNGGGRTVYSYKDEYNKLGCPSDKHLSYLASLDSYYFSDDKKLFVSHTALHKGYGPDELANVTTWSDPKFEISLLWNRTEPVRREYFQVFGHNSHWGLRPFTDPDGGVWALCIDQSRKEVLTGFHWPTGEIIEEPY